MDSKRRKSFKKRLIRQSKAKSGGIHCFYCCSVIKSGKATKDHIVAQSRGGPSTMSNLVLSCKSCNHDKSNSDFSVWKSRLISLGISEERVESYKLFANNKVPKFHKGFLLTKLNPSV